jgi:hypothetical protein
MRKRERREAAWQNPSSGQAASASAQAASDLSSCATLMRDGASRRCAKHRGERRIFRSYAALFAPFKILAGQLLTRSKSQLLRPCRAR